MDARRMWTRGSAPSTGTPAVEPGEKTPAGSGRRMWLRWAVAAGGLMLLVWLVYPFAAARRPAATPAPRAVASHAGPAGGTTPPPVAAPCDGKGAPANLDFVLTDMHGERVKLSAFKGKALLINFWATWCPPCKGEIPALVELQKKYGGEGFTVLGVSTDDPPDALREFAQAYQINYPVLMGTSEFLDTYGPIWAIPVSIFVTREATICRKHMGPASFEEFERQIKALL
jgi:thiol-disulfide isomerase/thioredoxin